MNTNGSYRLQSRSIRGETVEVKNFELTDAATPGEALSAAQQLFPFIYGLPTCFAGTMYDLQYVQIQDVKVGKQIVLKVSDYND